MEWNMEHETLLDHGKGVEDSHREWVKPAQERGHEGETGTAIEAKPPKPFEVPILPKLVPGAGRRVQDLMFALLGFDFGLILFFSSPQPSL